MSDVTAAGPAAASPPPGGLNLPGLSAILGVFKRGDIALAVGVLTILVVLILPLPPILLDLFLAISIILSVLILMTALFIQTPLEFSVFPDRAADLDDAAAVAESGVDPADPVARP
jgi:flagellar biosynthesis protein FlhA